MELCDATLGLLTLHPRAHASTSFSYNNGIVCYHLADGGRGEGVLDGKAFGHRFTTVVKLRDAVVGLWSSTDYNIHSSETTLMRW